MRIIGFIGIISSLGLAVYCFVSGNWIGGASNILTLAFSYGLMIISENAENIKENSKSIMDLREYKFKIEELEKQIKELREGK